MFKYADDLPQLCPQRRSVVLKEKCAHIQECGQVNKLSIN